MIVRWNMEPISQSNHLRVNFDDGNVRSRKFAVTPFRNRSSTQPDHHDVRRISMTEHEIDHRAGIRKRQEDWVVHEHLTLDLTDLELQRHTISIAMDNRFNACRCSA